MYFTRIYPYLQLLTYNLLILIQFGPREIKLEALQIPHEANSVNDGTKFKPLVS